MFISADPPRVRRLLPADLAGMIALQQAVLADLPPGFVHPRTESDLAGHLDGTRGAAYGIAEGGALAATSLLTLPSASEPGESIDAEIARRGVVLSAGIRERVSGGDWARATCFLGNDMVRREARGRGYQRALLEVRLAHAAAAGMRWVFSGVHLGNTVSWKNLLALGFSIVVVRFDPQHPMIGLIKNLEASAVVSDSSDWLSVAAHEPSQHQAALENGYVGIRIGADGGVVYERLLPAGTRAARPAPAEMSPPLRRDPRHIAVRDTSLRTRHGGNAHRRRDEPASVQTRSTKDATDGIL